MIQQLFPQKDTTLFKESNTQNTGNDQILTLQNNESGAARILIKFDLDEISSQATSSVSYYLVLNASDLQELPTSYSIKAMPTADSWEEGIGKELHLPITTDGASWKYTEGTTTWSLGYISQSISASVSQSTRIFPTNITGSFTESNAGGGSWYYQYTSSYRYAGVSQSQYVDLVDPFAMETSVTVTSESVYTFVVSSSLTFSSSIDYQTFASSSLPITNINQNDVFVLSGSTNASFTFSSSADDTGSNLYFIDDTGSYFGTVATASVGITVAETGDIFVVTSSLGYEFIVGDLTDTLPSGPFYFSTGSTLTETVASMSFEINSALLQLSATSSGETLILTAKSTGSSGNDLSFTSGSLKTNLSGGQDTNSGSLIQSLVTKINEVTSSLVTSTFTGTTLYLSASIGGTGSNGYSFTSGSTEFLLEGGGDVTSSFTFIEYPNDDTGSNTYYFITGSTQTDSVENLSDKINEVFSNLLTVPLSTSMSFIATETDVFTFTTGSSTFDINYPLGTTSLAVSQTMDHTLTDVRLDITSIVNKWLDGTISNNGLVIKLDNITENTDEKNTSLKYFSQETQTIYLPKLQVAWDDSTFDTTGLPALTAENIVVYTKNHKTYYKDGSNVKIRVIGRDRYPQQTFSTSSAYLDIEYLPSTSYYSVRDSVTDEVIIPFSDETKLSLDSNGNYFNFSVSGFQPERFYKFVFKVNRSGIIEFFDNIYMFKVLR